MDAKTARAKALSVTEGQNNSQYKEVLDSINKEVEKGKFKAYFYKSLSMGVQNKLTMDGYHISEHSDQRDGTTITISW